MGNRVHFRVVFVLLGILLFSSQSSAELEVTKLGDISVELDGWYRARGAVFSFSEEGYGQVDYLDHRLRLEVNLHFSENIRLMSEFSGLENVVWGQNSATGQILSQTPSDTGHDIPFTLNTSDDYREVDDFYLKRLYLEAVTPAGFFRVGRQPTKWGLGILANDGKQEEDLRGDTYDRILWLVAFDELSDNAFLENFYVSALYSQIVEGDTNFLGDDVREIVVAPFWTDDIRTREKFVGLYFLYRHASTSDRLTSNGDAFLVDLYASWTFLDGDLRFRGEMLYGTAETDINLDPLLPSVPVRVQGLNPGEPFRVDGAAFNFYLTTRYQPQDSKWFVEGEFAGQFGADSDQIQLDVDPQTSGIVLSGSSYTLAMDSDVTFDLIMFREAYAAVTELTPLPFDDSSGGVANAWVLRFAGGYRWDLGDFPLNLTGALVYGSVIEKEVFRTTTYNPVTGLPFNSFVPDATDLGIEIDVMADVTFYDRYKFALMFGYFIPGGFFEDMRIPYEDPQYAFGYYQANSIAPYTEEGIWTAQMRFYLYI